MTDMAEEKKKLLIVEDDTGLQKQLRWTFDDFEVLQAGNRQEAIAHLRRSAPPVVLQDLGLPPGRPDQLEHAELMAARTAWAELRDELATAQGREVDPAFRTELATLEDRLRDADEAEQR